MPLVDNFTSTFETQLSISSLHKKGLLATLTIAQLFTQFLGMVYCT